MPPAGVGRPLDRTSDARPGAGTGAGEGCRIGDAVSPLTS